MFVLPSLSRPNLNEIIDKYSSLVRSSAFNSDLSLSVEGYESIIQSCAYLDLKLILETIGTRISPLSSDEEKRAEFQTIMRERMGLVKETFLSPWENPDAPGNECLIEIFNFLFPEGTFFDYIKLLAPDVDQIGSLEEELIVVEGKRQLTVVLKKLSLTQENVAKYLTPNECIVVDNVIYPVKQFTRHTDNAGNKPIEIARRNQLYANTLDLLDSENHIKLKEQLFRHPVTGTLYAQVRDLKNKGQTLRDALIRLKRALILAGIKHTGRRDDDDAPVTASLAVTEFHVFVARFPEPDSILQKVEVNRDIVNLKAFLQHLHESDRQCVEQAAGWLDDCLRQKNNEQWLSQSPILRDEDIRQLKRDIHFFWKNNTFHWSLVTTSNLPLYYLKVLLSDAHSEIKNAVSINLLMHVSSIEAYEHLLMYSKITKFIRKELAFILIHLSDTQLRYFFHALTKNLNTLYRCGYLPAFLQAVNVHTAERKRIIIEILRQRVPALLQSRVASPLTDRGIRFVLNNNVQTIMNQINETDDTVALVDHFDQLFVRLSDSRLLDITEPTKLRELIKNYDDLSSILPLLNPSQINSLISSLSGIELSIETALQFQTTLQTLNADQIHVFLGFFIKYPFIKTFDDYIFVFQDLSDEQAEAVFDKINIHISFENRSFLRTSFNPMRDAVGHQINEFQQKGLSTFARLITSATQIGIFLSHFEPKFISSICATMVVVLNRHIRTATQLGRACRSLNTGQIISLLNVLQSRLPELVKSPSDFWAVINVLQDSDDDEAFVQAIASHLPNIFDSVKEFKKFVEDVVSYYQLDIFEKQFISGIFRAFSRFATSAELIGWFLAKMPVIHFDVVCSVIPGQLDVHVQTTEQLRTVISLLDSDKITEFLLILKPRLAKIIKSFEDFVLVLQLPTADQVHAAASAIDFPLSGTFNSIQEKKELLTPLDDEDDGQLESRLVELQRLAQSAFSKFLDRPGTIVNLLKTLRPSRIPLVCSIIPSQLQAHIKDVLVLRKLLDDYLDPEQTSAFLRVLEPRFPELIKTIDDFIRLLMIPNINKRNATFNAIYQYLPHIVNSITDYKYCIEFIMPVLLQLNPALSGVFNCLPKLATDSDNIGQILACLTPACILEACNFIVEKICQHVQTPAQLLSVLQHFNPEQSKAFLVVFFQLMPQLFYIPSIIVLLPQLDPEKCNVLFDIFIEKVLPHSIYSLSELGNLLCVLMPQQIISTCQIIILSLTQIVINNSALRYILMLPSDEHSAAFIKTFFNPGLQHDTARPALIHEIIDFVNTDGRTACPLLKVYFDELREKCAKVKMKKPDFPFFSPGELQLENLVQLLNHQHNNPVEKLLDINSFALENSELFEKVQRFSPRGKKRSLDKEGPVGFVDARSVSRSVRTRF